MPYNALKMTGDINVPQKKENATVKASGTKYEVFCLKELCKKDSNYAEYQSNKAY